MCGWDYTYMKCDGLEFIIHSNSEISDDLMFDVDYNDDFLILDTGDELEVEL